MAMIYDLDNEYGGTILADAGSPGPALSVNSNAAQPALSITSTPSANPISVTAFDSPALIRTAKAGVNALNVGRVVVAAPTVATLVIAHPSAASAPLMEFGHFASITSVILTTVANTDYAIRVKVGDTYRWIPLWKDAGVIGAAAF